MSELDLDALAAKPLTVRLDGETREINVTVGAMMRVDRAWREEAPGREWELLVAVLEEAGVPRERTMRLGTRQMTALTELVTRHFFPEAAAAAGASLSLGATPSPPTGDTAAAESP